MSKSGRIVKQTIINGVFSVPMLGPFNAAKVSTVRRRDPITGVMIEPQVGVEQKAAYETRVLLGGVAVYRKQYRTYLAARHGHDKAIDQLLSGALTLSIGVGYHDASVDAPIDSSAEVGQ